MNAFLTGGTGFLGQNLLDVLLARGWQVTAMARVPGAARPGVTWVGGDLLDAASVERAMPAQVDAVFHVAGDVSMWRPTRAAQWALNVEGTRAVLEAARTKRAKRVVLTSAAGVYGLHAEPFDETSPKAGGSTGVGYLQSKLAAEQLAFDSGLDVVVLNPGHIIGRYDTRSWSRTLLDLRDGTLSGAPPGRGTFCHATRVAEAHEVAARRGRAGANYLLGGADATYGEAMAVAAGLMGVKAPPTVPALVLRAVARAGDVLSRITRRAPAITPELAVILTGLLVFSSARATAELDYRSTALAEMYGDAKTWLETRGM